jgi:RNA polymerase sigma-70 factor (ECF subfamily)
VEAREPGTGSSVQGREQQRRLLAALADLDPEQRAIIVLRDVQGLDYEQIAAALGIAVGTVKSRLFRARLALRQLIEKSTQSE